MADIQLYMTSTEAVSLITAANTCETAGKQWTTIMACHTLCCSTEPVC